MTVIVKVLSQLGHTTPVSDVKARWSDLMEESGARSESEYRRCYPEAMLADIAKFCVEGVEGTGCRLARSDAGGDVHLLLNQAWDTFWKRPADYPSWERRALETLRAKV